MNSSGLYGDTVRCLVNVELAMDTGSEQMFKSKQNLFHSFDKHIEHFPLILHLPGSYWFLFIVCSDQLVKVGPPP